MPPVRTTLHWKGILFLTLVGATLMRPGSTAIGELTDSRLNTRVAGSQRDAEWGETLGDYVERLSKRTKVTQSANSPFNEYPIVILSAEMPLRNIHRALADAYHLTWNVSKDTPANYTLDESAANRQARANARSKTSLKARQQMLARVEQVRRLAYLPPDELRKVAAEGDRKAASLTHPRATPMARLLFQLPASMWEELWKNGSSSMVRVSDLTPDLQELAKRGVGNTRVTTSGGDDFQLSDVVVSQGQIKLQFGGTVDRPTIWGSMRYGNNGTHFNLLYPEAFARQPPEDRRREVRARPTRPPSQAHFRKTVTLKDRAPKSGFEYERPAGARPLAEYLSQLAKQVDIPIVADCEYQSPEKDKGNYWLRAQWWLGADIIDRPLAEALDLLCADFEYEWEFKGGALLLRPRRWFMPLKDRGYVVPKNIEEPRTSKENGG